MNSWNTAHTEIGDFFWLTVNNINHLDVADKENAGGKTVTWQRHHDQIKLKLELHAPSVCEMCFSAGSLRSVTLKRLLGKGARGDRTYYQSPMNRPLPFSLFFVLLFLFQYINLSSSLPPSRFGWGDGFLFFSSPFSLLSGLLLLSVLGLPLIFQAQFLYLPLLVEKTLSLLWSFFFF